MNNLKAEFENARWMDICNIFENVDDIAWSWEYLYKEILKNLLTTRKAKIRSDSLPWINSAIRKEMNLRYKLLKYPEMLRNTLKTPFTGLGIEDSGTTLHSELEKPKQITGKANLKMLEILETFGK